METLQPYAEGKWLILESKPDEPSRSEIQNEGDEIEESLEKDLILRGIGDGIMINSDFVIGFSVASRSSLTWVRKGDDKWDLSSHQ
ncbi:hypothetical protein J6590_014658 [Homalodisca vitripennis]|nr:hypothetical protein J6590_014658 [Homalodisca vitripennis]